MGKSRKSIFSPTAEKQKEIPAAQDEAVIAGFCFVSYCLQWQKKRTYRNEVLYVETYKYCFLLICLLSLV